MQALGIKRACPECSTKFYDLNKDPATCPQCQKQFSKSDFESTLKSLTPSSAKKQLQEKTKHGNDILDESDDSAAFEDEDDESIEDLIAKEDIEDDAEEED